MAATINSNARSPLGQRNLLWRLVSPIVCLVAFSGSNCLPTGLVSRNGTKFECGDKKISKCLKFSSRHLHRAISAKCPPSGTKWREHIALWCKQSANWNPLECWFRATWRATEADSSPKRAKWHPIGDYFAKCHLVARHSAPLAIYKNRAASQDFLTKLSWFDSTTPPRSFSFTISTRFHTIFNEDAAEEGLNQVADGRYLYSRQVAPSGGKFKPIWRPSAQTNHQWAQSSRLLARMAPYGTQFIPLGDTCRADINSAPQRATTRQSHNLWRKLTPTGAGPVDS